MGSFRYQDPTLMTQTIETVTNSSFSLPYGDDQNRAFYSSLGLTIFLLVVILPLNIYVLWLIRTGAGTGVASEFFTINLCGCEIIICFSAVLYIVCYLLHGHVESPLYVLCAFLPSLHIIGRPFFQCCISVERYVAVVHPVIFLKYKPLRYQIGASAVAWLLVLGFSIISFLTPLRNRLYYVYLPLYLVFFSVMVLCSVAVLKALRKPGPGNNPSTKDSESNNMKKKAFSVIVIILIFMVVSYGPMVVFIFLYDSLSDQQRLDGMVLFSYLLVIAGFVQPFLYLHRVGKIPFIQGLKLYFTNS